MVHSITPNLDIQCLSLEILNYFWCSAYLLFFFFLFLSLTNLEDFFFAVRVFSLKCKYGIFKFTLSNTNIHTLAHIDLITTKQGTRTRHILFSHQINIKVAYYGTHYSEFIVVKHEWYLFYKNI
jgi:hypothetical protein